MKLNVSEKYIQVKEKNMTICILTVSEKDKERYKKILEAINQLEMYLPNGGTKKTEIRIPSTFKGTVTLKDGDTFDEKIGKKMAREAAYIKADDWFEKFYYKVLDSLYDNGNLFQEECMKDNGIDSICVDGCYYDIDELDNLVEIEK